MTEPTGRTAGQRPLVLARAHPRASRAIAVVLLLVAFLIPWPGLGPIYARVVASLGNALLERGNPRVTLVFKLPAATTAAPAGSAPVGPPNPWRLDVAAEDAVTGRFVGTALDLRRGGYIASAVFAALALATATRWRKRLALLFCGLAPLQMLALLPVLSFFSGKLPVKVFSFSRASVAILDVCYHALVAPPGMAYAVPALLWLALVWLIAPEGLPRSLSVLAAPPPARGAARPAPAPSRHA